MKVIAEVDACGRGLSAIHLVLLLRELVEDGDGLVDLAVERVRRVQELDKCLVLHLQEHARDLASEVRMGATSREHVRNVYYTLRAVKAHL